MEPWKAVLAVACCPLWLPLLLPVLVVGFLGALTILVCRFNPTITLTDNALCVLLFFVQEVILRVNLKGGQENGIESECKAWGECIETREDLEYTAEKVPVDWDDSTVDLHITRPKDQAKDARLPVFLHIHGGGDQ